MRTVETNGNRATVGIVTAVFAGSLMICASAKAAISYAYENDGKTLVVTVDSGNEHWLQDDQYQAALNANTVTNLIKRGDGTFGVNGTARQFTGDARIEGGKIRLRGTNPLGTSGRVYVPAARSLIIDMATVEKDIVTESGGAWSDKRNLDIWGSASTVNGKLLYGDHDTVLRAYAGTIITFNGGVGNIANVGYPYFKPSGGATFVYSGAPYNCNGSILISPIVDSTYPRDSQGFAAHFIFSVAGNIMTSFGLYNARNNYWANWCELKTTVDWAFDRSNMSVYMGHDFVWELYGTEQRIGQMGVATIASGYNPPVVTNSLAAPATLHMNMIYGQADNVPDFRFGGNLSVIFENTIYTTKVDHVMTAVGDLTVAGNGSVSELWFLENGSWANATNVVVNGNGKMKIANPNALGRKANVSLKSNSSLEISSGVTVHVKTLTINGELQHRGDYTFGSGTLSVSHPCGFIMSVK